MNLEELLRKARETNALRDEIDRAAGECPPPDQPLTRLLETVIAALEAAIVQEDWDYVGEATVLAQDVAKRLAEPNRLRSQDDLQWAHDLLRCLCANQDLFDLAVAEVSQDMIRGAAQALCWTFGHDHEDAFATNLSVIEGMFQILGIVRRRHTEMQYPGGKTDEQVQ